MEKDHPSSSYPISVNIFIEHKDLVIRIRSYFGASTNGLFWCIVQQRCSDRIANWQSEGGREQIAPGPQGPRGLITLNASRSGDLIM